VKARSHPDREHWASGRVREERYAFSGEMRRETGAESREVTCLRDSLSEQDLESVGGASGREGLRRTRPSWEK
jgi:hypothetical protein